MLYMMLDGLFLSSYFRACSNWGRLTLLELHKHYSVYCGHVYDAGKCAKRNIWPLKMEYLYKNKGTYEERIHQFGIRNYIDKYSLFSIKQKHLWVTAQTPSRLDSITTNHLYSIIHTY